LITRSGSCFFAEYSHISQRYRSSLYFLTSCDHSEVQNPGVCCKKLTIGAEKFSDMIVSLYEKKSLDRQVKIVFQTSKGGVHFIAFFTLYFLRQYNCDFPYQKWETFQFHHWASLKNLFIDALMDLDIVNNHIVIRS